MITVWENADIKIYYIQSWYIQYKHINKLHVENNMDAVWVALHFELNDSLHACPFEYLNMMNGCDLE